MTKQDIINQLSALGDTKGRAVLVHSALRLVGIDGKLLLDALIEHFTKDNGLLCIPTHTWHNLRNDIVLNMASDDNCLGALSKIAINDDRGIRSPNPTHSMVVFGEKTKVLDFIKNEECIKTPTAPESAHGKLYYEGGDTFCSLVLHMIKTHIFTP